ncbi:DUF2156 domain-containing protein [Desulfonatronovibrio magnus]|uniref:DUF2156 domain-containing protein n=1 Tax=Desulfonatronovibrio magnus TaxID=698827 RepID=UPI0005EBB5C3|nr:phosphatidylglycerol lysyltransferase domain-containing protein [Desulfonatronovibrio magnus]
MNFTPISLKHQDQFNVLLQNTDQIASDYSFANIYGWADEYGLEISFSNDLAWIRQTRPRTMYWAPVGNWKRNWTESFQHIPTKTEIVRIPEKLAEIWQKDLPGMSIFSDREHWDYLYSVSELVELKGNRFHKKKNLYNQFIKKYNFSYVELEKKYIEKALALQTEWCLWKECDDSGALEAENNAIVRVFSRWEELTGLFGAGLMIDQDMVAYTVAEALPDNTLVIHFEKGCPGYKGVYQAINKLFLEHSASEYTVVNREQDLGDPGLKKAKESYNPIDFLKKFNARL